MQLYSTRKKTVLEIVNKLIFFLIVFNTISCKKEVQNKTEFPFAGYQTIKSLKDVPYARIDYSELKTIKISKDIYTNTIDLSSIIDNNVKIIKLETNSNCLIGQIDDIFFDDNHIFIVDKRISESVLIFDNNGNFRTKLSKKGKGPEEFLEIRDISIDRLNNRIVILDLKGRKLSFYDYNGNFLFTKKMYFYFSSLKVLDSINLALLTATSSNQHVPSIYSYDLVIGNIYGEASYKAFPLMPSDYDFTFYNFRHLHDFNGVIDFYPRFSDTIFQVNNGFLNARYAIDFQGNGFPKSKSRQMTDDEYRKLRQKFPHFYGDFVELERFLYLIIDLPGGRSHLFYDKESGNIRGGNAILINRAEDLFFGYPITSYSNNTIVSVSNPSTFIANKDYYLKEYKGKMSKELETMLNSVTESDNPIIFMYNLKPF